ncbi:Sensor histidine kinase GlrK [Polaromonas vacuolata]|uniref:Signal transduction histidine-protein kinase/phosphatase MprB n=1 Tax=Polaromonas vacuolata TaxID=37448 RepID=A0A6H2HC95_9BURK|nr:HAMP domain-containing sensor histidine kinase [Polaromonas vacuolata]QJC57450.1 Sensor histidine kinase GlrK [Polaromonas vacuolata]
MLKHISFRQLLVLAFLLIATLLAAVCMRALSTLEDLTMQSRSVAARALDLSASAQFLRERSVVIERSSRQAVVLGDQVLRERFNSAAGEISSGLQRLAAQGVAIRLIAEWQTGVQSISALLNGTSDTALEREQQIVHQFRELDDISAGITLKVQQTIEGQNQMLLARFESSQESLTRQVFSAIALAVALALGLGIWLTRPLQRLEKAIKGLGENRLDEAIHITGPADLQMVGQRLDWLRLRLVELDADKARFLRHVSHELKTPLASLREGVSLLEEEVAGVLTEQQREIAQILRQNTSVLQGQIEDLLRFNAAAFEARQLHREKTDLTHLIEAQIEDQRLQWRAKNLQIQLEGTVKNIEIDAEKITTAVANLLSNAIRFSPSEGIINIRLSQQPASICIDVQDQGPGIAQADRERVFEPFYRGERQPLYALRGSGIGLSIVNEYISAHGGRLHLLPEQDNAPGAHFRIELTYAPTN